MYSGLYVSIWFLANVLFVGLFDIYAIFFLRREDTVSYWFQAWLRDFPILGVALGVIIGHLAWPIHRTLPKE